MRSRSYTYRDEQKLKALGAAILLAVMLIFFWPE
jgi:hypothetical protein